MKIQILYSGSNNAYCYTTKEMFERMDPWKSKRLKESLRVAGFSHFATISGDNLKITGHLKKATDFLFLNG